MHTRLVLVNLCCSMVTSTGIAFPVNNQQALTYLQSFRPTFELVYYARLRYNVQDNFWTNHGAKLITPVNYRPM
jgi:hypothetical protein